MSASRARRVAGLVVLALAVLLGAATPGIGRVPVARAAETDLTLVTDARYDVDPAHRRVRITLAVTASNHRAETRTRRFYFDRAYLAVLPGTSHFAISGDKGARVRVVRRAKTHTMLRIDFGSRLYSGKQRAFKIAFELRDKGGAVTRETRIGSSLVSFPVWAFASDGASGSSVAVTFPKGYAVTVESGELPHRATDASGRQVFRSGTLGQPLQFFAYVVAEREPTYRDTPLSASVDDRPVDLTMRAWSDDPAWAKRIGGLLTSSLPELGAEIGLPWRWTRPLVVQEAVSRSAGGYAGLFDPAQHRIEVAYWANPLVVLHEAAHAWFNGSLLADRWANEGFASLYATRAAGVLDVQGTMPELNEEVEAARIPLNAWGRDAANALASETYGYAASLELARAIAERAGDDALQAVWADAADGVGAYQQPVPAEDGSLTDPEPASGPPDWRGLLDLLEARTGLRFDDLWRTWVVRDEEASLLDERAAARTSYVRTLALADGWILPREIRDALRAWQFEAAERLMADARTVLAQRTAVEQRAAIDGVRLPDTMRSLFEAGELREASLVAADQLDTIHALEGAFAMRPADPDPLTRIGLLGETPDADLAVARASIESGDFDAGLAATERALRTWERAWEEGRRRALLGIAVLASLLVLVSATAARARRSRRRAVAGARGPGQSTAV